MPELPEVETIRRQLRAAGIEGRRIERVRIDWPRTVDPLTPAAFARRVKGRTLLRLRRHGKWLIFELDAENHLLIHLRMTGGFGLTRGRLRRGPHDRVILRLAGGLNLHYRDPRKFGRWRLGPAPAGVGPDALRMRTATLARALGTRRRMVKALLLDQSFVAGIGNIYADESLFAAGIDPRRNTATLTASERAVLAEAIKRILRAAVRNQGTSLGTGRGNYRDLNGNSGGHRERVQVYGRAGQPCPCCGSPLQPTRIAQRTTVFCARCQH
ncbi:bifunctional DNA-formamidopyrimidine glycosylase/DNA-(apurinic or apyrimidinic site) lyase [Kiritimatiella glycovorans]|uniref:Formamidopyrimidine-DNA glycosylase n=1 Tax=Kiritimatiella glycovorans TaxID=1307763 RepID=A0A0G3EEE3_9BACT|nr:bifunctional DNA-formamidopyrimidine glycosylase/DNA-(apurinic or apyrimidinic site) lyase [Kiritimatiella glycovorans]AKJ64703.1 Formamidopyrimidine-DNA glycosylase [Kiritimatiella glycovorans]